MTPTGRSPTPPRPEPSPAVGAARTDLAGAHTHLSAAIDTAADLAGRPEAGGRAIVDPAATDAVEQAAAAALTAAKTVSAATASHLPLSQVRPGAVLLETERKLLTHAIRMSAYNTETTLARLLRPHYAGGEDEARTLLREAFALPADLQIIDTTLHVRLEPATAPGLT